jgi:exonuclease III
VLAGDFNVIPTPNDVYKPERWVDDALFRVETREAFARLMRQGWTDALRTVHPQEKIYTFWDYFRNAYERDAGLRIDHLLLNPPRLAWLMRADQGAWWSDRAISAPRGCRFAKRGSWSHSPPPGAKPTFYRLAKSPAFARKVEPPGWR